MKSFYIQLFKYTIILKLRCPYLILYQLMYLRSIICMSFGRPTILVNIFVDNYAMQIFSRVIN